MNGLRAGVMSAFPRSEVLLAAAVLVPFLPCRSSFGKGIRRQAIVMASDASTADLFGFSLAVDGRRMIAGAPGKDDEAGAAYIFERRGTQWEEVAKLTADVRQDFANFGSRVAIDGDTAVVLSDGFFEDNTLPPIAYMFQRTTTGWEQVQKIPVPPLSLDPSSSGSIAGIDVVGDLAFLANTIWKRTGSTWQQIAQLEADGSRELFGRSVAASTDGKTVVVGDRARAFVFRNTVGGWEEVAKLHEALDPVPSSIDNSFGSAVDIDGNRIVVGAPWDDQFSANRAGAAFVFENTDSGWNQIARFDAGMVDSTDNAEEFGGSAVAIAGNVVVVGSPDALDLGVAHLFEETGRDWRLDATLTSNAPVDLGMFGVSTSIEGNRLFVGETPDMPFVISGRPGAIHVFVIPEPSTLAAMLLSVALLTLRGGSRRRPVSHGI